MARRVFTFLGRNGDGVVTVSGLRIADKLTVMNEAGFDVSSLFSSFVVTDDEVIQLENGDLSAATFFILVE